MWPKYGVADATPATPLTPSLGKMKVAQNEKQKKLHMRFLFIKI